MADLCALGIAELGRLYRSHEVSPVEVARATLDRIERLNPELKAFLTVLADSAMAQARAAELQLGAGVDLGPLHGMPVCVKDNINVRGARTTAASRVLLEAPPEEEDAPVVRRLRAAGAVLVGKANLYEFAFGYPDPEGPFGLVQNPRKIGHQAGGSSSGSAVAVAAGLSVLSLGTDTGASIRHPASVCGVVGLKPTYGLVSIRGVIPVSVHLDHVGPLGRSVADVAAGLAAIAGHDPQDPYSVPAPVDDYLGALGRDVRELRLGMPTNAMFRFGPPETGVLREQACRTLAALGMAQIAVEVPRAEEIHDVVQPILMSDLIAHHRRYRGRESLYTRNFAERFRTGFEFTGAQYAVAMETAAEIRRLWADLFQRVDILALPANVMGAPPHGQDTIEVDGERHLVRMVNSRFSRLANLTGFPAMVVPIGATPEGMPIALQLVGPPFGEARLFAVGHALEQALGDLTARWGIEPRRN